VDTWGFGDAWSEHHLQKGQGVGGRAFSSKSSCFSSDMTQLSKSEYPLSCSRHRARTALSKHRYFGLRLGDNEGESNILGKNLHCYPFKQFVVSFNRSSFSSAAAVLSFSNNNNNNNTDKEQKMASAEQLVFKLSNPDLRENAFLDLSKVLYLI
ncbi:hypothetical protein IFM89_021764, partial [Coptis chinensis]